MNHSDNEYKDAKNAMQNEQWRLAIAELEKCCTLYATQLAHLGQALHALSRSVRRLRHD